MNPKNNNNELTLEIKETQMNKWENQLNEKEKSLRRRKNNLEKREDNLIFKRNIPKLLLASSSLFFVLYIIPKPEYKPVTENNAAIEKEPNKSVISNVTMYRAPSSGDSGTYFVLKNEKIEDGIIKVLTSRIGKDDEYTDFTELKIDCVLNQYFELAGSNEDGAQKKPTKPLTDWSSQSKWTSLVTGSSKYDLVQFVCKK